MVRATVAGFCLLLAPLTLLAEEPLKSISVDGHYIPVTAQQEEMVDSIEERFEKEIKARQKTATDSAKAVQKLKFEMVKEMEGVLTPAQLERLHVSRREHYAEKMKEQTRFLREFGAGAQAIADSTSLIAYEGLPRPEFADIKEIKAKTKTVELEKYDFYAERLELSASQQLAWRELLSEYRNYMPYRGAKLCGGFHPDLLFEFKLKEGTLRVLICFGCHEVEFIGPKGSFMVDMEHERFDSIYRIAKTTFRERKDEP